MTVTMFKRLSDSSEQQSDRMKELRSYVRFGENDARTLRDTLPLVESEFPRVSEVFYDRIREHQEANAVLRDDAQVDRLKKSLVRWQERVFSGPFDATYVEQASTIGKVHVAVGLQQRFMLTAMSVIREELSAVLTSRGRSDALGSLRKIMDIELAIMLDAYRTHYSDRLQQLERQERRVLGETLRRTELRYVSAVELSQTIIVGLSEQGNTLFFNEAAEAKSGYSRDMIVGKPFVETFVPPEVKDEVTALLTRIAKGGVGVEEEVRMPLLTRSRKVLSVQWHFASAPRGDGDVIDDVAFFAYGRDVTQEEDERSKTKHAERLLAIGTLAAGLAHEIRNPLNGAALHLQVLERSLSADQTDALDAAATVRSEVDRLSALVTEFLEVARPAPLTQRPVSLNDVIAHVVRLLSAEPINVTVKVPPSVVWVRGDEHKLIQVLLNLGRNAMEAQATSLSFVLHREPRTAVLEIRDDGTGLSKEDRTAIFDAFFSTKSQGTGLGLSIVLRIVSDHDGSIELTSAKSPTVFRISLPLLFHTADGE